MSHPQEDACSQQKNKYSLSTFSCLFSEIAFLIFQANVIVSRSPAQMGTSLVNAMREKGLA